MKTSIGRIVLVSCGDAVPSPAVITRAWSDTCVNVRILPDGGCVPECGTSPTSLELHEGDFDDAGLPVIEKPGDAGDDWQPPVRWWWPPRVDESAGAAAPKASGGKGAKPKDDAKD